MWLFDEMIVKTKANVEGTRCQIAIRKGHKHNGYFKRCEDLNARKSEKIIVNPKTNTCSGMCESNKQ